MNKFLKLFLFLCLGIFLVFQSCVKKNFDLDRISGDYEWDPAIAIPGVKASLTVRDIVQDFDTMELFVADETGFLYLMYHKHIFSVKASDLIIVPDQIFPSELFSGSEFIAMGFNTTQDTVKISHAINQLFTVSNSHIIDSIILKSALLNISCTSDFLHTGELVVRFPYLKKNGVVYTKTIPINDATGSFSSTEYFNDLDGYTIDLFSASNQLPIEYDLSYFNSGSSVNASNQAIVNVYLSNIEYGEMYGYFGQDSLSYQDTIKLEIFNQAYTGNVNFVDPHFNVYFNNSYGMPIKMEFGDFTTITPAATPTDQTFPFANSTSLNPITINSPTLSQIGQAVATSILLDKNNSEVNNIINTTPQKIIFQMVANTNPSGNTSQNFITDESQFDMDLEIELPMWGNASYFSVEDTNDLDFEEIYKDFNSIEYIKIRINVDNGMPTDVKFQLFFADSNKVRIDSLFTKHDESYNFFGRDIVSSGVLDGNGKVVEKTHKFTEMKFDRERLKNMKYVKYIMFRGWIKTTNEGNTDVRFYADYSIDMKVGLLAKFNFNQYEDYGIDYNPNDTTQSGN